MPSVLKSLHTRTGHRAHQHPPQCANGGCYSPAHTRPATGAQASIRCAASAGLSQSHLWVPQHDVFHSAAWHPSPNGLHCSPTYKTNYGALKLWQRLVCSRASMHFPIVVHPLLCVAAHLSGLLQATHASLCLQGTAHLLHVLQPQLRRVAVPLVGGHYPLQLLQALHEGHRCRALLTHCPIQ